jgi:type IV pilus assembly protein PilZ
MGRDDERDDKDRRIHERFAVAVAVDYSDGNHFLFSYIENISEMGIFIRSDAPLSVGTDLVLRFAIGQESKLELEGVVMWVNPVREGGSPNPGMGVRFRDLTADQREAVVDLIRTVAYLADGAPN